MDISAASGSSLQRRELLKRFVGAGVVVLGSASALALNGAAAGSVLPLRRDISSMPSDDPTLRTFRKGVSLMKARSEANPLDPLGWHIFGGTHSIFCATNSFRMQVHYGWYFLPWHRAYSINLERKIRLLTGDEGFAVPYWDWTRNRALPAALFGADNPLNNTTRIYRAGDVLPADFTELSPAMRGRAFHQFAGFARDPQHPQIEGTLEQGAHNNVHNWIGGDMASFDGAGFDPMFMTHHGNIDRLWEAWMQIPGNANPTDAAWLDFRFPFYGVDGEVEQVRIGDLLDTRAQGYGYDRLDWRSTLTPETTPEYPGGGAVLAKLTLTDGQKAKVRRLLDKPQAGRIMVQYARMQVPIHPLCHRIFLLHPGDAAQATPLSASYCGTFTLLPISDPTNGLDKVVTTQIEVPKSAFASLLRDEPFYVTAVPVPLKGRKIPDEPLRLDAVSLIIDA